MEYREIPGKAEGLARHDNERREVESTESVIKGVVSTGGSRTLSYTCRNVRSAESMASEKQVE